MSSAFSLLTGAALLLQRSPQPPKGRCRRAIRFLVLDPSTARPAGRAQPTPRSLNSTRIRPPRNTESPRPQARSARRTPAWDTQLQPRRRTRDLSFTLSPEGPRRLSRQPLLGPGSGRWSRPRHRQARHRPVLGERVDPRSQRPTHTLILHSPLSPGDIDAHPPAARGLARHGTRPVRRKHRVASYES